MIVNVSAVALIDSDSRILISTRPSGKSMEGLWEFPGGKIEKDEKPEDCIIRELEEELSIKTYNSCLAPFTFNSFEYDNFYLVIYLFLCRKWEGSIIPKEGQDIEWVYANKLAKYPMPKANIHLCAMLRDYL